MRRPVSTMAMEDNNSSSSSSSSLNHESTSEHDQDDEIQMMPPDFHDEEQPARYDRHLDPSEIPIHSTNIPRVTCALLASLTTGGVSYAFGLYGAALKKNLQLSQSQLETISTATFFAGLFSWIPGMYVDRFGTRAGIRTGGVTGAASLLLYWAVAKQMVEIENKGAIVGILSALSMCIFLSCALVTGAVFKVISCSCEAGTKGQAVGVAKGFVGLGSGLYACLFQAIRGPTTSDLDVLPMCAFFLLVAASIPSVLVLPSKVEERKKISDLLTPLHFRLLFGSLLVMAVIIIGSSLLDLWNEKKHPGDQKTVTNFPLAGLLLLVWWAPIVAQIYLPRRRVQPGISDAMEEEQDALLLSQNSDETPQIKNKGDKIGNLDSESGRREPSIIVDTLQQPEGDDFNADESEPTTVTVVGHKNLYQMLQTYPAWLMLWTATILVGGGTVETNNLGQMVESLHFPAVVTSASLSLFSVAQCGGRVATGALSDWALTWETRRCLVDRGVPRPFFLVVACVAAVIAHTILAFSTEEFSFVIGIALSGLAFGSVWPLMVLITGEIYGTAHVGANYMFFDGFTSAAGTFILSKVVAQQVYDSHLNPHYSDADDGATCYGQKCFQMTHIVIAVLSLICIGTSLVFQYATKERYNSRI